MTAKKILAAALKQFAEKGYDGTSLAEIAGAVGIKKPSIYAHYKSKYDLFLAVAEEVTREYHAFQQRVLSEAETMDFEKRLYYIFESIINYFVQDKIKMAFWIRVLMFPPAGMRETALVSWKHLNSSFMEVITGIIEQGIEQRAIANVRAQDMARTYLCLLDGFLSRVIISSNTDYIKFLPQVWKCFWCGAKP